MRWNGIWMVKATNEVATKTQKKNKTRSFFYWQYFYNCAATGTDFNSSKYFRLAIKKNDSLCYCAAMHIFRSILYFFVVVQAYCIRCWMTRSFECKASLWFLSAFCFSFSYVVEKKNFSFIFGTFTSILPSFDASIIEIEMKI